MWIWPQFLTKSSWWLLLNDVTCKFGARVNRTQHCYLYSWYLMIYRAHWTAIIFQRIIKGYLFKGTLFMNVYVQSLADTLNSSVNYLALFPIIDGELVQNKWHSPERDWLSVVTGRSWGTWPCQMMTLRDTRHCSWQLRNHRITSVTLGSTNQNQGESRGEVLQKSCTSFH